MCGIAGQVRADGGAVDPDLLEEMCAAIRHRGPDARGLHLEGSVGLGIQRLRVIDLATGDQPIHNEDGTVVVVLNGEIYNYRELRRELAAQGHRFATDGDTEVIVHLYEEHGERCVERLHGMFAFALWDSRRRRLMLARDRLGKKPLVYALDDRRLSFASELGALVRDPTVSRDVDPTAIDAYLRYGYVPAPLTGFSAARKLPPAHVLLWSDGKASINRYWKLDFSRKLEDASEDELCEQVREGILAATRRRLVSDVPVGAFLSGGIDSAAVVAAMAQSSTQPVQTFSIGFEHDDYDELPHARAVSELYGTEHHEFVVRTDAIDVLPQIVRHHGEPFADSSAIPSFYLASMARRHVTVALNGDGGDEAFGGYTRYVSNALAARLDRIPAPVRAAAGRIGRMLPASGEISGVTARARRLAVGLPLDPSARYARNVEIFDVGARAALYDPGYVAAHPSAPDAIDAVWAAASGRHVVDVMLEVDTATYLPGDLIPKIDIATMAHGLEARSPLLDHELMELAAAIPATLKVRGSQKKWILRQALRPWLPDTLLDRPKQGFSVPVSSWLRTDLSGWADEILLDSQALGRGWFREGAVRSMLERHRAGADVEAPRIWALLMLELWLHEVVRGADVRPQALPVSYG